MELFIGSVIIMYVVLLAWLWVGWHRAIRNNTAPSKVAPMVTVLVPVRNEEKTIASLLKDLLAQQYPHFEIIVIDDHSEDDTLRRVDLISKGSGLENIQFYPLSDKHGKKAAITLGVTQARGEIILTIDADCSVGPQWIQAMTSYFSDGVNMVTGAVRISANNSWSRLQQMELASVIATGAATLGWNIPTMANGANLAYKKEVFLAVNGYAGNEAIPSGDDEFLLHKVQQAFPDTIRFCAEAEALCTTCPSPTISGFLNQRIRWAAKWKLQDSLFSKVLAVSIFLIQLLFLTLPWLTFSGAIDLTIGIVFISIKALVEFFLLLSILKHLSISFSVVAFLTLQLFYPYYVVAVALLANLKGYHWKGRRSGIPPSHF